MRREQVIDFEVWCAATQRKPASLSGFRSWLKPRKVRRLTREAWTALYVEYLATPTSPKGK